MTNKENLIKDFMKNFTAVEHPKDVSSPYEAMQYAVKLNGVIEKLYNQAYAEGFKDATDIKIEKP